MRNYEITNIIREGAVEETKSAVKDILAKHSVTIQNEEDWGSKRLWHPVGQDEQGHFTLIKCQSAPSEIVKIEHEFKLNTNILKTLVVRSNG
ncbi:30S ribosomal protein S6 [Leptospira kobayashii]|uniref:Small ribosomal subunit protein bS6 n=1 Tax=Leptospira kobayashii TaxID=1917830 RepID=A0ABM7UK91_9LEPT|nr:30S ribosomal protein S6 [Leptospira kobayashii]BDA79314.1 30S ribosomal protein S6 [Leptospira kobayashii]